MRKFLIIMMVAVIAPAMAFAGDGSHSKSKKKHHQIHGMKGVKLDKGQTEKMRAIRRDMKRFMIKHHATVNLVKLDLEEELQKGKPDKGKLDKLVSELAGLKKIHETKKLGTLIEMADIMSREQRLKFLETKIGKKLMGKKKGHGGKGH